MTLDPWDFLFGIFVLGGLLVWWLVLLIVLIFAVKVIWFWA